MAGTGVHSLDIAQWGNGTDRTGPVAAKGNGVDASPKLLLKVQRHPNETRLVRSDNHALHFLDCVRTRRQTIAPAEVAHRSTTLCHLGYIACRLNTRLRWNPATEQFPGDDEANRMLHGALREPWRL